MKRNYFRNLKNGSKSAMALVAALCLGGASLFAQAATLKLHYSFAPGTVTGTTVNDVSGNGYNGTLTNNAAVLSDGTNDYLDFGTENGYLDMGATTGVLVNSLSDFSISLKVNFATAADLSLNGQWLWCFSNSLDMITTPTGSMFFEPRRGRAAISKTNYGTEQGVEIGYGNFPKGAWTSVVYVQKGTIGYLFINGVLKAQGTITIKPSDLGATPYNFIGRPTYTADSYAKNGQLSDFRVYSGALTTSEVVTLAGSTLPAGFPMDLYPAIEAFTLGDLTSVTSNITLPTTAGDGSIAVTWASSNTSVISTTGVVTRPETLDTDVLLTGTFTKNGVSVKQEYVAHVLAMSSFAEPLLVHYTFPEANISGINVTDEAEKHFVGTLQGGAVVRKLGTTESGQVNVLDLGTTNGYFDFGAEVGKLIYGLSDFSISAYFRVHENYTKLNDWGNCLWTFNNSDDPVTNLDGDMYFNLKNVEYNISSEYWGSGNRAGLSTGTNATKGVWNHVVYTQKGDVGTTYLNGVQVATGAVNYSPFEVLVKDGKTGTAKNSIGKPAFASDIYLGQTMVYDFRIYNEALTADDVVPVLDVESTLELLEAAYAAKVGDVVGFPAELQTAYDNLTLGDISGVTSNLTLPTTADGGVTIVWSTSNAAIIDATGAVTRPEKLKTEVLLTATLSKNGYDLKKPFSAFVLPTAPFSSTLLFQYTFEDGSFESSNVKDKGEMQYVASMQNGALIRKMGDAVSGQYNALDLGGEFGESEGYLDLGTEIGKLTYGLSDFTMSAYFRVNENYADLGKDGNWLFTFANSNNSGVDQNGYFFLGLKNSTFAITDKYWNSGNQQFSGTLPVQGTWNHIAYTQTGGVGTIYMNGVVMATQPITHKPAIALPKLGLTGTLFNYIGKSSYQGDAYLKKTYVTDIRMYSEAKSAADITGMSGSISALNAAYAANPGVMISTKATNPQTSYVSVVGNKGKISIYNLIGTENVTVKNLVGQPISVTDATSIVVNPGIYLVSINGEVYKVLVK